MQGRQSRIGCQKYSSSVRPSGRGRSWVYQCQTCSRIGCGRRMALYFAMVGAEFEMLEPAEARRRRVLWANVFVVTVRHRKVRSCNWFRRHPPSCS